MPQGLLGLYPALGHVCSYLGHELHSHQVTNIVFLVTLCSAPATYNFRNFAILVHFHLLPDGTCLYLFGTWVAWVAPVADMSMNCNLFILNFKQQVNIELVL